MKEVFNNALLVDGINNVKTINFFKKSLNDAGFNVLDTFQHHNKSGYFYLFLLEDSRLSIQTKQDDNLTVIELSSYTSENMEKLISIVDNLPEFV